MKKITRMAGITFAGVMIAGCENAEEEAEVTNAETLDENSVEEINENAEPNAQDNEKQDEDSENNENSTAQANENENAAAQDNQINNDNDTTDESSNESGGNESETYAGTHDTDGFLINTHTIESEIDEVLRFFTAFSFEREQGTQEELIETSLSEGDPSEQHIIDTYTEISMEWPELDLHFTESDNQLSATSAQSRLFYDSLFGITDLYGIETVSFLNPEGDMDITVAERLISEPVNVKDERGVTRGYYTVYDEELEETLFLSGGELEEQVTDENDDPLSFEETVEAMQSVEQEDAFYDSALIEGIEVQHASMENGIASVQYTIEEDSVTEADQIVFEKAMQLAALDFHAWEIRLYNDTAMEKVTYILLGQ